MRPLPSPPSGLGLVTHVRATGRGIIILAGPSSCGKGAVAEVLRRILHIPEENHISMGEALRRVATRPGGSLEGFGIHERSVFDPEVSSPDLRDKAERHRAEFEERFPHTTQRDWLEYCVLSGLLVPDAWSEAIIDGVIAERAAEPSAVILLDGYPRTEVAARHVMRLSERVDIPILKVLHLSVSKREMHKRALGRRRADDTPETLERRYKFYVEHVQPCVELLKSHIGSQRVALIDAHQPEFGPDGTLDLEASVANVANEALIALGVSRHILGSLQ